MTIESAIQVPPECEGKDPRGCWNVRCQLGKVCCRAAIQGEAPSVAVPDERAAFTAWHTAKHGRGYSQWIEEKNRFAWDLTQELWLCWQARAASPSAPLVAGVAPYTACIGTPGMRVNFTPWPPGSSMLQVAVAPHAANIGPTAMRPATAEEAAAIEKRFSAPSALQGQPIQAHSKSQFKRLSALGADVAPPLPDLAGVLEALEWAAPCHNMDGTIRQKIDAAIASLRASMGGKQ